MATVCPTSTQKEEKSNIYPGVVQLGARVVWDHQAAGSIPVTRTKIAVLTAVKAAGETLRLLLIGGKMSLVISVACGEFVVMGGEGKAVWDDGLIITDFRKVFKINNNILIGIAGTLQGISRFAGFLFNIQDRRFVIKGFQPEPSYNEIKELLDDSYDDIMKSSSCDTFFVAIAGWDGKQFCMDSYFYNSVDKTNNQRSHIVPQSTNDFKCVCLENCGPHHFNDFVSFATKMTEANIIQTKNAIKNTIDIGIAYDDSINKNYIFETIRKKEVSVD